MKVAMEGFNVLNHTVFGAPGATTTTSSTFGIVTGTATGNSSRVVQVSAKILF
jgi:hypothetical protein